MSAGWGCHPLPEAAQRGQAVAGAAELAPVNTAQPLTGVVVDEWTEMVPNARETTAITFQFAPSDAVRRKAS